MSLLQAIQTDLTHGADKIPGITQLGLELSPGQGILQLKFHCILRKIIIY